MSEALHLFLNERAGYDLKNSFLPVREEEAFFSPEGKERNQRVDLLSNANVLGCFVIVFGHFANVLQLLCCQVRSALKKQVICEEARCRHLYGLRNELLSLCYTRIFPATCVVTKLGHNFHE